MSAIRQDQVEVISQGYTKASKDSSEKPVHLESEQSHSYSWTCRLLTSLMTTRVQPQGPRVCQSSDKDGPREGGKVDPSTTMVWGSWPGPRPWSAEKPLVYKGCAGTSCRLLKQHYALSGLHSHQGPCLICGM